VRSMAANICPNCNKSVFHAEEVRAIGKYWHKRCLRCAQCNKALDAGSINDRQGKVYCKSCYNAVAGFKGFGLGLASESSVSGGASGQVTYENAPLEEESALSKGFSDGYQANTAGGVAARPVTVPEKHTNPALLPQHRLHQEQHQQPQQNQPIREIDTGFNQVTPSASSGAEGWKLVNDGDWAYFDINLAYKGSGHGADDLKKLLQPTECGFAFWRIVRDNVGNAGVGVVTEANIVLQYKGPQTGAMKKVKSNSTLDAANKKCPSPFKGFIEVITNGPNLTDNTIFDRWRPGSGSKVIDA